MPHFSEHGVHYYAMISISNLGKMYGDRTLFAGVSMRLTEGKRYGLVGANGSGKTTLLDILTDHLEPSEGEVTVPRRARLGVLRQDQFLYDDQSIISVTLRGNQALWEVMVEKEALLAKAEEHFDAERFSELEELIDRYDGYSAEARASAILEGLGLPTQVHHDPLSSLSGGFKLRVLLAQVLASEPDALLLDEPTNHLDVLSIRWLEMFLRDFAGPAIVISHDHRFLDNVSTHILDVDYETVTLYRGNYTVFMEAKKTERQRREKDIAGREREIAHHQKFVERFKAKATKARAAGSKQRVIDKMTDSIVELPRSSRRYPTFRFDQVCESGRDVLKIEGVKKAFGDNEVLHGVDLLVQRGDRVAIMGPNGIGKSTLLKIVIGELESDEGTVEWGYETHPGYFAQDHREAFRPGNRQAQTWVWDACPDRNIGFVRSNMGKVLFTGDDAEKPLDSLSGGEAARLLFCKLAIGQPNVLVLDEPTNHLDLESIDALVEGLRKFPGTLILVSHDRWFVSQLATRVVEIKVDDILDYQGTYEDYVHFCGDDHLDADRVVLKARQEKARKQAPAKGRPERNGSKGKRKKRRDRRDALMARLEQAEVRVREIDETFCAPSFYQSTSAEDIKALEVERAELTREVEELMAEWEKQEEAIDERDRV